MQISVLHLAPSGGVKHLHASVTRTEGAAYADVQRLTGDCR